ncbi:MAG: FAD-dependent oxidoreductase [Oscillospiraceae bacterium]|nr:FAD-dependent oxidoreductase [Oscillospiraceae bacterium]
MNISRRDFLKGTAAGALSIAATSLLSPAAAFADGESAGAEEAVNVYKTLSGMNPQDYDFRSADTDLSAVFSPWKFGGLNLNHRMVKSAAGSDTQKGSEEEAVEYYAAFAKGGVEMVWVEDFLKFHDNFPSARATAIEDSHVKAVVDGVHAAGGYIGYQLSCMGRSFSGFDAATAAMYESAFAEHLTREEVKLVQEDFINGAKKMKDLGFDAVEINAAGNNIGQAFFSRQRNHRDDEYGPQSFENRARFVGEIITGIKEVCGKDFPVQVLINGIEENDIDIGQADLSTTVEENCKICKSLEEFGADSLHVRLGVFRMHVCQFASDLYFTGNGIIGTTANGTRFDFSRHFEGKLLANHDAYGMMLNVAKEIKQAVSIPVGTVTCMNPAHAPKFFNDAIANGMCDFFIMNRPLTVDTEYVNKLREGRLDEIAPCTRCMHCHFDYDEEGKTYEHCRVNAATQRAWHAEMPEGATPLPADGEKKVMVIGGGPGGMEAARIAAQRGYDVTLYEKQNVLGGLLTFANVIKGPHENLDDLKKYLIRQLELKGVKVVTGTEVTREMIEQEAPDYVVLAVGGQRPALELQSNGATEVISLDDIAFKKIGDHVTILGGNAQAVDAAQYLIAQGKHVTMVLPEGKEKLDKGQSSWVKQFTIPMLYANGTRLWPNASVKEVRDGEIVIDGETGCDIVVKCETVIDARDMLPNTGLIDGLSIPAVAVGDCNAPFNIAEAIAAGNLAARKI